MVKTVKTVQNAPKLKALFGRTGRESIPSSRRSSAHSISKGPLNKSARSVGKRTADLFGGFLIQGEFTVLQQHVDGFLQIRGKRSLCDGALCRLLRLLEDCHILC